MNNLFFEQPHFLALYLYQTKTKNMFTKENGKTFVTVLAAVMVGLAAHQMFFAPHIHASIKTPAKIGG